jgi:hypothetical protein
MSADGGMAAKATSGEVTTEKHRGEKLTATGFLGEGVNLPKVESRVKNRVPRRFRCAVCGGSSWSTG